jgi:hypothetical protein
VAPERACEFKSRLAHHFDGILDFFRGKPYVTDRQDSRVHVPHLKFGTVIAFLLAAAFVVATASADVIRQGTLQATSDGMDVTVRWMTEDEAAVAVFEVERRGGTDGEFMSIGHLDPKGPSLYEFVDHSAFMKTGAIYQYRIKVSFSNGQAAYYTNPLTISHTVSGVRRTWGSIKAMFR